MDWDVGNGVAIGVGVALLLLGRRFLGLFVALVGFGLGHSLALESMGPEAGDQALALGAVVAVAGAVAVLVVRKVVSRFVGLVGGAYGGFLLGATLVLPDPIWGWVVIGVCAAVGFVAGRCQTRRSQAPNQDRSKRSSSGYRPLQVPQRSRRPAASVQKSRGGQTTAPLSRAAGQTG